MVTCQATLGWVSPCSLIPLLVERSLGWSRSAEIIDRFGPLAAGSGTLVLGQGTLTRESSTPSFVRTINANACRSAASRKSSSGHHD